MALFDEIIEHWFCENGRSLPWRETKDPYRIWISEIILQQTRVNQGYQYYLRFIERFPDVKTLASGSEEEVLHCWQGLGYYSRARNLHQAARDIVEMTGGDFPDSYEKVRALRGVGDYTAAAICSFAYDMPWAVVDGNVYRVLARVFGISTPIDSTKGRKEFVALANELLDVHRPALYNQAIMDFGALVCTPQSPRCGNCPLSGMCVAFETGDVNKLPVKQHKTKQVVRYFNYIYVRANGHTFLNKRRGNDVWRNLYELPLIETDRELSAEEVYAHPTLREWIGEGLSPVFTQLLRGVKHVLSHQIIYANFYLMELPASVRSMPGFLLVPHERIQDYPVSRLVASFFEKSDLTFG